MAHYWMFPKKDRSFTSQGVRHIRPPPADPCLYFVARVVTTLEYCTCYLLFITIIRQPLDRGDTRDSRVDTGDGRQSSAGS